MGKSYSLYPLGDSAVLVQFGDHVSENVHRQVANLARRLERMPFPGMVECVPSYSTVGVHYDPVQASRGMPTSFESVFDYVCSYLTEQLEETDQQELHGEREIVEIPVCYGGEHGPDLDWVAEHNGVTAQKVVELHSAQDYLIYAIGFAPGFPYIGGVSERIAAPRKQTPRPRIPAGSVGIAGTQTGIYPIETPGGWQIIGRTPIALFRPEQEPPTQLKSGQYIRFRPIGQAEYKRLEEERP